MMASTGCPDRPGAGRLPGLRTAPVPIDSQRRKLRKIVRYHRRVTFSIVACDLRSGSWGVAVASKYLAVGSMVPAAASDAGALATQAWTNAAYRGAGLAALREGLSAEKAVARLVEADADRDRRQVAVV